MYSYDPQKEVIETENFFPKYTQKEIYNMCMDKELNWKYYSAISYGEKTSYDLTWGKFGKVQETDGLSVLLDNSSEMFNRVTKHVTTYVKKFYNIDITYFLRVMFVITPPNPLYKDDHHLTPHIDLFDKLPYKNFLYYINDNDAETLFFNQKFDKSLPTNFSNQEIIHRVKPEEGKAAIWDGSIFHAGNVSKTTKRMTLNVMFK